MNRHGHRMQRVAMLPLLLLLTGSVLAEPPSESRQAELMNLLVQDCGSCHGLKLTGGLGPPLTRDALAGKSAVMLREVILHGRPGTPMPAWSPLLTREDVDWIVSRLLAGEVAYVAR